MRFEHQPSLDGLRGVAVAAVLLFHADIGWAAGGFHGLDVFFVLSGFLITTLLLQESTRSGTISLTAFWGRRVRRLLPALLVMLLGVCLYAWFVAAPTELGRIRRDGITTLLYVSNWAQITDRVGYFEAFGVRSPLLHTWSLAVEEQYYLLWPLVVSATVWLAARRMSVATHGAGSDARVQARSHARLQARTRRRVGALAAVGAIASTLWMARLASRAGIDRIYYGTDTHGLTLLVGSALAAWAYGRWASPSPRWVHAAGVAGALVLLTSFAHHWSDHLLARGGYLVVSLATAAVIRSVVSPTGGPLAGLLSWGPLRRLGVISYGAYLWHWPLNVYLSAARTGWPTSLVTIARLAGAIALGELSFRVVETPFRRRIRWPATLAPVLSAVVVVAVLGATTGAVPTNDERFALERAAAAEPPTTAAPTPPPITKVLVLGDSLAASLAQGWDDAAAVTVADATWSECGRATAGPLPREPDGPPRAPGAPSPCGSWERDWPRAIELTSPDVVIIAARSWAPLTPTPALRAEVTMDVSGTDRAMLDELERVRAITSARGAATVLAYATPAAVADEAPFSTVWRNGVTGFAATRSDDVRAVDLLDGGATLASGPSGEVLAPGAVGAVQDRMAQMARGWHLERWRGAATPSRIPTLLVGDSVGWSLGSFWYGGDPAPANRGVVQLWNRAQYFCELDSGPRVERGVVRPLSGTCKDWRTDWRSYVDRFRPRLVLVVLGHWEVSDRRIDGKLLRYGSPEFDSYFASLLDEMISVLGADGATVVLASAFPVLPSPDTATANGSDATEPARFEHFNSMLAAAAARHDDATVVDVASRVCPTAPCPSKVEGIELRPDGTHFGPAGGVYVSSWLEPRLAALEPSR